jgi:formylglycine-generating enzyme required for sulfatase activity
MKTSTLTSRLLAIAAAFSFVLSAMAYDFTVDGVYYNITGDNTVEVTSKTTSSGGYTGEVTVPATVTNGGVNYQVTAVGDKAFYVCSNVTAVHLPATITSIGENAFYRCTKMADVNIPDGVVTIAYRAFDECKALTTVTIPSSVVSIGNMAFYQCIAMTQVNFNEGLQTIGTSAFADCKALTQVEFPVSVTSIGQNAFENCTGLTDVTFNGATSIGLYAFVYDSAITSVTCLSETPPSMYNSACFNSAVYENAELHVATRALHDVYASAANWQQFNHILSPCDFEDEGCYFLRLEADKAIITYKDENYNSYSGHVIIPKTVYDGGTERIVVAVDNNAFKNCDALISVEITGYIERIGASAFAGCSALTSVYVYPFPPTMAGSDVFDNDTYSNATLYVPFYAIDDFKSANYWRLFNTIKSMDEPDFVVDGIYYKKWNVTTVAVMHGPEKGCYSGHVTIPPVVLWEGNFYNVKCIEWGAFYGCPDVTDVTIPTSVVSFGQYCFAGTGITSTLHPDYARGIAEGAYKDCTQLKTITINANMVKVEKYAFAGCTAVETVICKAVTPPLIRFDYNCFSEEAYNNATLYVPGASYNDYKVASGWRRFANIVGVLHDFEVDGVYYAITDTNTVAVTARDNRYNSYSGSIEIPSMVTYNGTDYVVASIAQYAFYNCTGLTSVTIPMSVTEIGNYAFLGCTNVSQVICTSYTPPVMAGYYAFDPTCYQNATLIVPDGTEDQYQSTDWWNQFTQAKIILRGDVNGDGTVNIADVTAMIDYLLSGDESSILLINGDVNKDGTVNIADVTALIDYLLSGAWPFDGTVTIQGITFNMVAVEGGTFTMGATPEQGSYPDDNEKPAHQVTLSDYYIGETEVTQALWLAVMGSNPSQHQGDLNYPVERVSWNECQIFISRLNEMTGLNFRMPTEAEWEYAARGGKYSHSHMYAGSDLVDEVAWNFDNSGNLTHLVATKRANELGLYDMSGNVSEWCYDCLGAYTSEAQTNPTGPTGIPYRVQRGGDYNNVARFCRVSSRGYIYPPSYTAEFIGLRLAL